MEKVFMVEDMMCGNCEKRVNNAVTALDGVSECKANAQENNATVIFDSSKVSEDQIKEAIEEIGYDVK